MRLGLLILSAALMSACAREAPEPVRAADGARKLSLVRSEAAALPVAGPAAEPFLYGDDRGVVASWLESGDGVATLKFARYDGARWSPATPVASGGDFFVNWADFPSVVPVGGNRMVAHWLQKSADGTYTYDVRLAVSDDSGRTWRQLGSPHDTTVDTEYGFVSIEPAGNGDAWVVWLDGRQMEGDHGSAGGAMQTRVVRLTRDDQFVEEAILDRRNCECCQTAMTVAGGTPVVAWRDRSESEVRDIAWSRRGEDGEWQPPALVYEDGWTIPGCPVNGPQLASDGSRVAVAWFTAGGDRPRVLMAFSDDGARTWGPPVLVSDRQPIGRVDVVMQQGAAVVTWLEGGEDTSAVRAAVVDPAGEIRAIDVGRTSGSRASGFPRAAALGDDVLVAWTIPAAEEGQPSRIEVARLALREEG